MHARLFVSTAAVALTLALVAGKASAETTQPQPAAAEHHAGYPLMKGLSGPQELAKLIDDSLAKDRNGNAQLTPSECTPTNRSRCATPRDYLDAIIAWHPKSGVTQLSQLSAYVKSWSKQVVKGGEYYSSRMIEVDGKMVLDLKSGFKRPLRDTEYAWYDTQTGEVIALEDCANIALFAEIEQITVGDEPCAEIEFPTQDTDGKDIGVNIPILGTQELPASACWGIRWAGTTVRDRSLPDHCPEYLCNLQALVNATGRTMRKPISEVPTHFGVNIFFVPMVLAREDIYTTVFCWTKSKDGKTWHSKAVGIRSVHFVHRDDGTVVATIKPSDITYPAGNFTTP